MKMHIDDKYIGRYIAMQDRIAPGQRAVDEAVKKASEAAAKNKAAGGRPVKQKRPAFASVLPYRAAIAALIMFCISITVPVIAGVVMSGRSAGSRSRTYVEKYIEVYGVAEEYIQDPNLSTRIKNVEMIVERYIKTGDDMIIDITVKNHGSNPNDKYNYNMEFDILKKIPSSYGFELSWYRYEEVFSEYNAESNSVHKSFLIKDVPEKLIISVNTGVKKNNRDIAEVNSILQKSNLQENVLRDIASCRGYIVLDLSDAKSFAPKENRAFVKISEEDIKKCIEASSDDREYALVPFELIFTEFGITYRVNKEVNKEKFEIQFDEYYNKTEKIKWPWKPSRVTVEYEDGVKVMFAVSSSMHDIPRREIKDAVWLESIKIPEFYCPQYLDDEEETYLSHFIRTKHILYVNNIKAVYVDGIKAEVNIGN